MREATVAVIVTNFNTPGIAEPLPSFSLTIFDFCGERPSSSPACRLPTFLLLLLRRCYRKSRRKSSTIPLVPQQLRKTKLLTPSGMFSIYNRLRVHRHLELYPLGIAQVRIPTGVEVDRDPAAQNFQVVDFRMLLT